MNDYAAQFANAPAVKLPQAGPSWRPNRKIEWHLTPRSPFYEYITASVTPENASQPARYSLLRKLENHDVLVTLNQSQLERMIAAIYEIQPNGVYSP
jgi:hypothetical protein